MPASLPAYAELRCLSNFSFLRGASHPGELVARAKELGYAALAHHRRVQPGRRGARARGGQGDRAAVADRRQFEVRPPGRAHFGKAQDRPSRSRPSLATATATATCAPSSPSSGAARRRAPTASRQATSTRPSLPIAWCWSRRRGNRLTPTWTDSQAGRSTRFGGRCWIARRAAAPDRRRDVAASTAPNAASVGDSARRRGRRAHARALAQGTCMTS